MQDEKNNDKRNSPLSPQTSLVREPNIEARYSCAFLVYGLQRTSVKKDQSIIGHIKHFDQEHMSKEVTRDVDKAERIDPAECPTLKPISAIWPPEVSFSCIVTVT